MIWFLPPPWLFAWLGTGETTAILGTEGIEKVLVIVAVETKEMDEMRGVGVMMAELSAIFSYRSYWRTIMVYNRKTFLLFNTRHVVKSGKHLTYNIPGSPRITGNVVAACRAHVNKYGGIEHPRSKSEKQGTLFNVSTCPYCSHNRRL